MSTFATPPSIAGQFCGQMQPHAAHPWVPPSYGQTYYTIPQQCAGTTGVQVVISDASESLSRTGKSDQP